MANEHRGAARLRMAMLLLAPVLMLAWVAVGNLKEDQAAAQNAYHGVAGAASVAEEQAAQELLAQAYAVLRSPQFRENLLGLQAVYPVVYARRSEQEATIAELAAIISLEPWGTRYAPVQVFLVGGQDPGDIDREQASAGEGPGSGRYADMILGRAVIDQYRSGDLVERSCAINVAAHEYSHTISLLPVKFRHAFTDTRDGEERIANRRHPGTAVASYLIGAVAQCTYLQTQGRVPPGGVPACVEIFGVRSFNWTRCGAFPDGRPVVARPGLPPAARPL